MRDFSDNLSGGVNNFAAPCFPTSPSPLLRGVAAKSGVRNSGPRFRGRSARKVRFFGPTDGFVTPSGRHVRWYAVTCFAGGFGQERSPKFGAGYGNPGSRARGVICAQIGRFWLDGRTRDALWGKNSGIRDFGDNVDFGDILCEGPNFTPSRLAKLPLPVLSGFRAEAGCKIWGSRLAGRGRNFRGGMFANRPFSGRWADSRFPPAEIGDTGNADYGISAAIFQVGMRLCGAVYFDVPIASFVGGFRSKAGPEIVSPSRRPGAGVLGWGAI